MVKHKRRWKLYKVMKESGYSNGHIADYLGVKPQRITNMKSGKLISISTKSTLKLCELFKCDPKNILTKDDYKKFNNSMLSGEDIESISQDELTQDRLKFILDYNESTGKFKRLWPRGNQRVGDEPGTLSPDGYRSIMVDNKPYKGHRLAWLYVYGYTPHGFEIDHINRVRNDNRISNLRLASRSCNAINRGIGRNNTSGITGIGYRNDIKKWRAYIGTSYIGYFENFDDAVMARWKAEIDRKYPTCNTTSTAYLYLKKRNLL